MSASGFDRLARIYLPLERIAFGRDLERARFALLPELRDCRRILVLGDGDGRGLERLASLATGARIHSLDLSPGMLACAQRRCGRFGDRLRFEAADIRTAILPDQRYDAVVTCFFLDCFTPAELAEIVPRIAASLRPGARWLWSDFVLPDKGPARWRAQAWLTVMYAFFRWETGIRARKLPPAESAIRSLGFQPVTRVDLQWGLLRSIVFSHPASA